MPETAAALRAQLARQIAHWSAAAEQLGDLGRLASPAAWRALERDLDVALGDAMRAALERLRRKAGALEARLRAAETERDLLGVRRELLLFRRRYLAVETMLDFYGDAINTRTSPELASALRACDFLARQSLRALLEPLGRPTPPVLTYLDKGLGASILKAGLRLWDGRALSPVAAIRLVRHNLQRPTSLIHETGHQAAHQLDWVPELQAALSSGLPSPGLGQRWAGWASEIAGDAFAFVHTGYAALAALHDVLAADDEGVLSVQEFDPHPTGYLRVLLGHAMCRHFFGAGPWDDLARAWTRVYPVERADPDAAALFRASRRALPRIVEIVLDRPYRAFAGRSLAQRIDPLRVRPDALSALESAGGGALLRSSHWIRGECLRLLALSGYRAATEPHNGRQVLLEQRQWMHALGQQALAA